jgi:hypothetical protein
MAASRCCTCWSRCRCVAASLHRCIATRRHEGFAAGHAADAAAPRQRPLTGDDARHAFRAVAVSVALTGLLPSALAVHLVPVLQALELGAGAYLVAMLLGPAQVLIRLVDALFWRALHPAAGRGACGGRHGLPRQRVGRCARHAGCDGG